MTETSNSEIVYTRQQRIAHLARQSPQMGFTSLNHYLDLSWRCEAYRRTRKDGAAGVDGQTAVAYEVNLEGNLQSLLNRAKSGTYFAPPVRRVYIPKGTGSETRPLGIPTLEDKVLQRAVAMILEAIYEQDFSDCSYGFRPGRSAHQALQTLWEQTMAMGGCWILEVDIRKFFDTVDHAHLREFLRRRVRDGVLLRLIGKWLNAGVSENGAVMYPEEGTPQGGVISPLLANSFLHYVMDEWFLHEVQPRMKGRSFLIRYADDAVLGFSCEEDARRLLAVLPKRFGKYGLTLHPEKTRLIAFPRPRHPAAQKGPRQGGRRETFDLLGFTHHWGISQKGQWVVKRKTAQGRFAKAVRAITPWCPLHRHEPIREQHRTLSQKLRGHFAYYGLTGNGKALSRFQSTVTRLWRKWLSRRRRGYTYPWSRFVRLLERFPLPPAVVVHSVYRRAAKS